MESQKPAWSSLLKQEGPGPNKKPPPAPSSGPAQIVEDTSKSTKGIAVAVVDANAVIQGGERLASLADKFVSVPEVVPEIRDPTSRHRLSVLPFTIHTTDPTPEALKKVISFARATGDLQTLSDVDLKLIALTYTLEAQIHGTSHLRDDPPPISVVNVKRLPEKDLPGWGDNVPNLEEWEALDKAADSGKHANSRILPVKDLGSNTPVEDNVSTQDGFVGNGSESRALDRDNGDQNSGRGRKFFNTKREVKIDGKKMVAVGVDASQGESNDGDGEWWSSVSRSTQRRYLRRKAKREKLEQSKKEYEQQHGSSMIDRETSEEEDVSLDVCEENKIPDRATEVEDIAQILKQSTLEEESLKTDGDEELSDSLDETESVDAFSADGGENCDIDTEDGSEQSWMLRSLSESTVACVTGDFAMQNVILQMGLRLVAPGGMQIRELHRWVLKCHACNNVTAEVGRIFCPKCGNGGTLRKVAVTVGENGVVLAARKPRIFLRGTKFSLPLPKGGRDAVAKNPILREDQLPQKLLHPKSKKKTNKDDDFFGADVIFSHHTDKKAPHRPPVRQALAVFSGRRNPNDNHFSRARH